MPPKHAQRGLHIAFCAGLVRLVLGTNKKRHLTLTVPSFLCFGRTNHRIIRLLTIRRRSKIS